MAHIISLTGDLGSGKSTISDILCKDLQYEYIYTGKIQREIAERYNMTTTELNKYSETHPEIDEEIDATFRSLNESACLIVDSRLAWFFIPDSFKVFLKTNLTVSAERITNDRKRKSEHYVSTDDAIHNIIERKNSENKRYKELYGADCADLDNFNLVVDTSFVTPRQIADLIITEYRIWKNTGLNGTRAFISPKNLYPTRPVEHVKTKGCDTPHPVNAASYLSFDYIIDGHKRTSCAINDGISLIPVTFLKSDGILPEKLNLVKPDIFHEWEDFHSFRFLRYPVMD